MNSRKRKASSKLDDTITEKTLKKDDATNQVQATNNLYWSFDQVALLGKGTFGQVQLMYHHSKGNLYAGKMFRNENDFSKEVSLLQPLNHDNIIRCVHVMDDVLTIVLPVYTINLEELVIGNRENKNGLSMHLCMCLIRDLTRALEYLVNERSIVHRDIKPANIMFDDFQTKFILTDFGLACSFDNDTLTYEDFIGGSIDFLRPDMVDLFQRDRARRVKQSIHTELWPLAITYFFATTGRHPYKLQRTKLNWIKLANERPDNCLWMKLLADNTAEYQDSFDGYTRLDETFKTQKLQPLLIALMSNTFTFPEYFQMINQLKLDANVVYLFDVRNMKMHMVPQTDAKQSLQSIVDTLVKDDSYTIIHKKTLLRQTSHHIPSTSLLEPLLYCKQILEYNPENKEAIFRQDFMPELSLAVSMDAKHIHTLFLIALEKLRERQSYFSFARETYTTLNTFLVNLMSELETRYQMFDTVTQDFFSEHQPSAEFQSFVEQLKYKVTEALSPQRHYKDDSDKFSKDMFYFKQHLEFMDLNKLTYKRDQIQQTRRAMETAINTATRLLNTQCLLFNEWYRTTEEKSLILQETIDEVSFATDELHALIISEIKHLTI